MESLTHTAPNITYRFSRRLKVSGVSLAGEERMRHICRQMVVTTCKERWLSFTFLSLQLREVPLVYIPDLVKKVVDLLKENQRLEDHDIYNFNPMQDRMAYLA